MTTRYMNHGGSMVPDPEGQWVHIGDVSDVKKWNLDPLLAQPAPPLDGWLASMDPALRPHEHAQPAPPLDVDRLARALRSSSLLIPPLSVDGVARLIAHEYAAQPAPPLDVDRLAAAITRRESRGWDWFEHNATENAAAIAKAYEEQG